MKKWLYVTLESYFDPRKKAKAIAMNSSFLFPQVPGSIKIIMVFKCYIIVPDLKFIHINFCWLNKQKGRYIKYWTTLRAGQHYFLSCLQPYKPRSFVLNYLTVIEMSLVLLWILNRNRTNSEDGSTVRHTFFWQLAAATWSFCLVLSITTYPEYMFYCD